MNTLLSSFSFLLPLFPILRSSGTRRERVTIYSADLFSNRGPSSLTSFYTPPSSLPPGGGGVTLIRWCTHPLWGARNGRPSFTSIPQLTSVQLQYPAAILFFFFFFFFFIFFFFAKATAFHPFFSRSYTLWPRYLCWVRLINIWTPVPSHTFICMCIHR